MKSPINATFIDGKLQLDESVALPNNSRVQVTIEPIGATVSDPMAAWQAMKKRIKERPIHSGNGHFTRDELHERR